MSQFDQVISRLAPLAQQAARVRRGLERRRRQGPFRGYLDGINDEGMLRGWVIDRRTGAGRVPVGLFAGETMIDAGVAQSIREDVRITTGGEVVCGFQFRLSDAFYQKISAEGGHISVRTTGPEAHVIDELHLAIDDIDPLITADQTTRLRAVLRDELESFLALIDEVPEGGTPRPAPPPFARHHKLFETDFDLPGLPPSGHAAYLDYVRYRYRMDEQFEVEPGLESQDRYLYWYLTSYRSQERRRVPLSREVIDHLNAPITMGGHVYSVSRIMWWRMAGRPDMMSTMNLNDRNSWLNTLFWWAHQDATHMYFEDCLVPERFADALRGVHPSRKLDAYPLSYFTERYFLDSPKLHGIVDPGTGEGRKALVLVMLLAAARRPDLLRYIPRNLIDTLLKPDPEDADGLSPFARFVTDLAQGDTPIRLDRRRYATALRAVFFDLDSYSFLTRDQNGHRFEAAALPVPGDDPETGAPRDTVDVQLIGPLAKASGLGQATRLSAQILRGTGLSVRGVDFDLDNPAPEGFSSDTLIEDYGPARINLIHLNAESTPLAYAYQPDVFSNAYNIGYFFWELDLPAWCHYLGMEMLDEIWVSTDYGVQIYKPDSKGKPVVNVGMCFEEAPDGIDRASGRAFVNNRFRFDDNHFVCLVAFDSFSFVQRKNPVSVLKAFQKAFEGVPDARLVVKTQNRDSVFDPVQMQLWDRVDTITANDPRIVVMNETLSYHDLLRLKAGSDVYLTLHKSEGWGFGMIEAMNLGVPVVATGYSGNMDFCTEDTAWLVDYDIKQLQKGDYIFVRPGSAWAEPRVDHAAAQLRACYDNPGERARRARAAQDEIRKNFSPRAIAKRYGGRLRDILKDLETKA